MRLVYKPFGLVAGIAGGLVARRLFNAAWGAIDDEEPPEPTTERARWSKVIAAAAMQGAIFTVTRAVIDRGGARAFEHLFGVWPGEREPDKA